MTTPISGPIVFVDVDYRPPRGALGFIEQAATHLRELDALRGMEETDCVQRVANALTSRTLRTMIEQEDGLHVFGVFAHQHSSLACSQYRHEVNYQLRTLEYLGLSGRSE